MELPATSPTNFEDDVTVHELRTVATEVLDLDLTRPAALLILLDEEYRPTNPILRELEPLLSRVVESCENNGIFLPRGHRGNNLALRFSLVPPHKSQVSNAWHRDDDTISSLLCCDALPTEQLHGELTHDSDGVHQWIGSGKTLDRKKQPSEETLTLNGLDISTIDTHHWHVLAPEVIHRSAVNDTDQSIYRTFAAIISSTLPQVELLDQF